MKDGIVDTEQVIQNLISCTRALNKEIEDLKVRNNTLQVALEHYQLKDEGTPHQYTWDEAEKQFRVDL